MSSPTEYDEVVFRGDVDRREFVAFWLGNGSRVLAGMNVNVWDVNDADPGAGAWPPAGRQGRAR